jgi:2-(1,2-epoxy-1,2-dihydrophenyl)acetyl-CoA isomerase
MSESRQQMGRALYAALGAGDADTLRTLLAEDFVGDLTPGLPHGYGAQTYRGLEAMLTDGWGRVGQDFAMAPQPEEILVTEDYIIGRGDYVGTAISTGEPVRARFAHFWRVEGDEITSVVQVTDSATWEHALRWTADAGPD